MLKSYKEQNWEWRLQSLCKDIPEVFFPENEHKINYAAIKICSRCPVQSECLDFALGFHPDNGTWAGLSSKSIRKIGQGVQDADHGTPLKYFYFKCRCPKCERLVA